MCPVSVKHNKIVNMTLKLFKPLLDYENKKEDLRQSDTDTW